MIKLETYPKLAWRRILQAVHLAMTLYLIAPVWSAPPQPQAVLPDDTWAMFTIPNYDAHKKSWADSPYMRFWEDPSMEAFRKHAENAFLNDIFKNVEEASGISMSNMAELLQGQVTLALVPPDEPGDRPIELLALMDSGDQQKALASLLDAVRVRFDEADQPLVPSTIQGLPFYSAKLPEGMLEALSSSEGSMSITFGQAGSVLIMGTSSTLLEETVQRLQSQGGPQLSQQPAFDQAYQKQFRTAEGYGWIHFKPIYELIKQFTAGNASANEPSPNPMSMLMPKPEAIMKALGLEGIQGLSFCWDTSELATVWDFTIQAPENQRQGLLDLVKIESKDASPPPFVTDDVTAFQRIRFDARKSWKNLENMLRDLSPQLQSMLQMTMSLLGKDRDPNFDFRQNFIENLGDDFMTAQWPSHSLTPMDLMNPPQIFLLGSPNPELLVQAFIAASGLLPGGNSVLKERSFLGRTLYSIKLPTGAPMSDNGDAENDEMGLHFVAGGMYVAVSTNVSIIESYLRTVIRQGKPLKSNAAFLEAVGAAGGFQSGYIAYQNIANMMQVYYEGLRTKPETLFEGLLGSTMGSNRLESLDTFLNFSTLPPFETVKHYFQFNVTGNNSDSDGLRLRSVTPMPSKLKQ
ncbi:MAG: hypothetical protein P8L18_09900 [Verrucomicrobiota bacterium]|nr:hypothetical protein [Verrucomicrobiota bacterium]